MKLYNKIKLGSATYTVMIKDQREKDLLCNITGNCMYLTIVSLAIE